jgi:hypothetical protein
MCNSSARRIIARAHFRSPKGLTQAHAGQGGITLGLEQGEPRADFSNLGKYSTSAAMGKKSSRVKAGPRIVDRN